MLTELKELAQKPLEYREGTNRIIFKLAKGYAQLVGLDFDGKILPALKDYSFWEVDYLKDSQWGLSLMDAYRCLLDTQRTVQIMGGVGETVKILTDQGKKDLVAIDAGTGTGIFSVYLAALGCKKVYALELNEGTAEVAREFVSICGCSDVVEVIRADATQVDIPELRTNPAHLLISENLSSGLFTEPQFQIIQHLSQFLSPEAPIIPYSVELFVSLGSADWDGVDWGDKESRNILAARRLPNLSALTRKVRYHSVQSEVGMQIPVVDNNVTIPISNDARPNTLLISTKFIINKYGEEYILLPDSAEFLGKTTAIKLRGEVTPNDGRINVDLSYEAGVRLKKEFKDGAKVAGSHIILRQN